MATRSRSAGSSASTTGAERAAPLDKRRRAGRRDVGWPWLIVGVGFTLVKTDALAEVLHHRVGVIVLLGLGLAFSALRTSSVGIAVAAAPLIAFTLAPRSTALAIALGFGTFVLLLALFIAIGTMLHARQDRDRAHAFGDGARVSD